MVSVTGMTVAEIERQLDDMIINASIDELGQLILERKSGEEINAGSLTNSALAVSAAWPVNSLYYSTVPTNPGDPSMLGIGTWTRYGQGRVMVSQDGTQPEFDTPGFEGGAKTHQLSVAELASHVHSITHDHASVDTSIAGTHSHGISVQWRTDVMVGGSSSALTHVGGEGNGDIDATGTGQTNQGGTTSASHDHNVNIPTFSGNSSASGSNAPHNNLQPYIVVYVWRRTA